MLPDSSAADVCAEIAHLYGDGYLGFSDVDLKMRARFEQLAAYLSGYFGALHREALVGALSLDLEGLGVLEVLLAVERSLFQNILGGLLAHAGARVCDYTEDLADTLAYVVKVGVLGERGDENGGLGDLYLKLAQTAKTVFDVFEENVLEGAAVEPFEHHLAEFYQNDFFHIFFLWLFFL